MEVVGVLDPMAFTSSFFEMGIELALQGLDGDRTFTSGEAVTGSLLLKLDRPTIISQITISLQGLNHAVCFLISSAHRLR
jgi:hypothetical protein